MKSISLFALLALACTAVADDVAVLRIKSGEGAAPQFVVIEFYEEAAPNTVANFKKLAEERFYNGTAFHRIFPHQMVQAGDPLSKKEGAEGIGTGGPGYTLPPEINAHKQTTGAVAMARLGDKLNPARRSNGSQFYITLTPIPAFDGQYTIFGQVIEGLEVLDVLSQKPADTNDAPVNRIAVESVQIVPREAIAQAKGQAPASGMFRRLLRWF